MSIQNARCALEGFALTDWPDLTCNRSPSPSIHTSTATLPAAFNGEKSIPSLFLALARVLGAYCGSTDILLAHTTPCDSTFTLIRANWSNEQTWEKAALGIASQLSLDSEGQYSVSVIRDALGLKEKQFPCFAVLSSSRVNVDTTSEFPLNLFYDIGAGALHLTSSSIFIHPTVAEQLLSQVVHFLNYSLSNPSATLSQLPNLPQSLSSIYNRVLDEQISKVYPHIPQVNFATEYLRQRALSHPHSVAVRWFPDLSSDSPFASSEPVTYAQLDEQASKIARWLVARGLQPEDRVALCLTRDIFFHAALFGVMRAGGCYVPVDPDLPEERKAYIARDSNAVFVLTTTDLSPPDLFGEASVFVDEPTIRGEIEKQDGTIFNVATAQGLSYMLYTSGTTGNPKGCLLTNHGLAQAILALSSTAADVRMENLRLGRYLAVASIAFDVHLGETFVPIALGMPLFSAPRSELLENLPYYVNTLGITHLGIVPSLIEATLNAASDVDGKTNLRYIASGGEKMSDSILNKWANHPQVRLANFYGPSEVTIGCCARYMDQSTPRANIGRPFGNVAGYVVDSDINILPRGGVGELVVEGPLVGRGYHGRPDLTKKVFLEWPDKGCWAYRTGDLVRMLPDSTIEILGRIDTQIKLRGVRIESEGISAIVRKAVTPSPEATLDATTILAKHPGIGTDQLVSFVTWTSTVPIAIRKSTRPTLSTPPKGLLSAIRSVCTAELASYMRPSHIIPLTWLPLNSNGKTDAKVLLDIFQRLDVQQVMGLMAEDKADSTSSCTETEEAIFSVLKEHGPSHPGPAYPELSVFECGLDSLAVIRFTSDLKAKFHKQLSASDIMKNPLLKDIARLIESAETESGSVAAVLPVPTEALDEIYSTYSSENVETVLPPFPIQQGVVSRSAELDSLYVQHVILQCNAEVSVSSLKTAWERVISRHPILRTVFFIDQLMLQVVLKAIAVPSVWSEESSSSRPDEFTDRFFATYAERITKDINHHISTIPPLRLSLFTLVTSKVLVLSIHHALYDGVCLPLIISDAERAYTGSEQLPVASLKNVLARISSSESTSARQFWTTYFAGFQATTSPFKADWQESSPKSAGLTSKFRMPLSSVKVTAARHQVTLQALLSHAFAKLVAARLYKSRDVCFGVIRSGRLLPVENIESAICPTISLLPVRVNFDESGSSLGNIQARISETVDFENVPLSQIQKWVRPGEALFDVVFSISVHHNVKSELWTPLNDDPPPADYPLAVEIVLHPEDDSLVVRAGWLQGYLSEEFISQFLADFEASALDVKGLASESLPSASATPKAPQVAMFSSKEGAIASDDSILQSLRKTTAEFLGVNRAILSDTGSFISLGLDSIKAVGFAKRITKAGYKVTSTEVLKAGNIQKLAQAIAGKAPTPRCESPAAEARTSADFEMTLKEIRSKVDLERLKLSDNDQPAVYPATSLQSGMLSQTIASSGGLYIHNFPVVLPVSTDFQRLRSSWRVVTDMFSILRTSFHFIQETGIWTQVVHSKLRIDWSSQEFTSDEDYKTKLASFLTSVPWDEDTAFTKPPVSVRVFRPSSSSSSSPRFVLILHHALYDGLSVPRLLSSLEAVYRGKPLPTPVQFSSLLPEIFNQEKNGTAFWAKHLQGFIPVSIPSPAVEGSTTHTASTDLVFDGERALSILSDAGVGIQCLFQLSLAKVLSSLCGSTDIVFGHVVSGRGILGSEDVIGPMLNTIPCRIKLDPTASVEELLQEVHRSNMDVLSWQQASLRSIQKAMGVDRLWDCLFTFQPLAGEADGIFQMESTDDHSLQIQYALQIEVEQLASCIAVRAASRSEGLAGRTLSVLVNELAETIRTVLESVKSTGALAPATPQRVVLPSHSSTPTPAKAATAAAPPSPSAAYQSPPLTPKIPTHPPRDSLPPVPVANAQREPVQKVTAPTEIPSALLKVLNEVVPEAKDLKLETPLASLGIDSITAIQVAGKCRKEGLPIKSADLINSRTLSDIVKRLTPAAQVVVRAKGKAVAEDVDGTLKPRHAVTDSEYKAIVARFAELGEHIENIYPMNPGMKHLITEWQRSGGTKHQSPFPYCLPANVDTERLRNAWNLMVKRYPMLRSTAASAPGSGEPRLVVFKANWRAPQFFEEFLDDEGFHTRLIERLSECAHNPLSIDTPAIRVILFRNKSRTHAYLCIHIHHIMYDGQAMHMITKAFSDIYNLQEPTTTCDIQSWLGLFPLQGRYLATQEAYWKKYLPTPFRPVLFPRLHTPRYAELPQVVLRHTLSNGSVTLKASDCEAKARSLGTSLNAMFMAVWASVHSRYAQTPGATFALWQAARGMVEGLDSLAVPCVNIVPIHVASADNILENSKSIRQELLSRPVEVEQSDFEDIYRWTKGEGGVVINTTLNIIRVPKFSQSTMLLEGVSGPFDCPKISALTITPTLDEVAYGKIHKDELMIEVAIVEKIDKIFMAIDGDGSFMTRDQTKRILDDFVAEFNNFFAGL